ncbi:VOC family protein [Dyella choica]|uniref:Glyoxalase n=1 Tax=Dyella choica TaxID=1927959 RepID=A0A3S0S6S9_9GAMM|nr:VOC family protein [Dyella choica]RUL69266.1 glyoxalase [Dyella choica]
MYQDNDSNNSGPQRPVFRKIDHIAIAVHDVEEAIKYFTDVMGFNLERRLHIKGRRTGMLSAEMTHGEIKFVLCQGTEPESQVSRLISNYGPGVAHIALAVDEAHSAAEQLGGFGISFDTSVIEGPGLKQVFTARDSNSGLSFEFIERTSEGGFLEENVQNLFDQLEKADAY